MTKIQEKPRCSTKFNKTANKNGTDKEKISRFKIVVTLVTKEIFLLFSETKISSLTC